MKPDLLLKRTNKALVLDECATDALLVGPVSSSRIDYIAGQLKWYRQASIFRCAIFRSVAFLL